MITSETAVQTLLTENILPQSRRHSSEGIPSGLRKKFLLDQGMDQLLEGKIFRKVRKGGQKGKVNILPDSNACINAAITISLLFSLSKEGLFFQDFPHDFQQLCNGKRFFEIFYSNTRVPRTRGLSRTRHHNNRNGSRCRVLL